MKNRFKTILLVLALITSMALLSPVSAQQRGPKIDKLRGRVIWSPDAQLIAMQTCEVDILVDLIRRGDIEKLDSEGYTITSTPGFHMGHIVFNIRPNQTYRDNVTFTQVPKGHILSDINFRHAILKLYAQEEIVASIYAYIVTPVRSLVPPALGGWVNPAIPVHSFAPGDPTLNPNAKDGGNYINRYPLDNTACGILRAGGYWFTGTEWVTPFDLDGDGDRGTLPGAPRAWDYCNQREHSEFTGNADTVLNDADDVIPGITIFTPLLAVAPTSAEHGLRIAAECQAVGVPIESLGHDFSAYLNLVFAQANFDAYMVFWGLGRFPDHLYDMLHSSQICGPEWSGWTPWLYNGPGVNDTQIDAWTETIKFSLNHTAKLEAAYAVQDALYNIAFEKVAFSYLQLYSRILFNGFKVHLNGIVNEPGYGSDNGWTYLNLYWTEGHERLEDGLETVVYCVGEEPESFNPTFAHTVYAIWYIGQVLDGLMGIDPYTLGDIPWLATDWAVDPYDGLTAGSDPGLLIEDGMTVTYWLRDDVTWQCGNNFTAQDCEFNWLFMRDNQIPRYTSTWQYIESVEVIDDYTVRIFSNETSQFLLYDFAGIAAMLPPPVWGPLDGQPLDDILAYDPATETRKPAGAGDRYGQRDGEGVPIGAVTHLYGTGAFIFDSYSFPDSTHYANREYFLTTDEISLLKQELFWAAGDVDRDGTVYTNDINRYGLSFGYSLGEPEYDEDCDFNEDGLVDALDGVLIGFFWDDQKEYP
jgi:peptide/nickel transport system substrate-binding protein